MGCPEQNDVGSDNDRHGAMIVAMVAVLVMQSAIHEEIEVVAVRHLLMAAAFMITATGHRSANVGIGGRYGDDVLIVVPVMGRMQMPIVQEIDVTVVQNPRVTTPRVMLMRMFRMDRMAHGHSP